MELINRIQIEREAEHVWRLLSEDFDKVSQWMSPVYNSYKITGEDPVEGASMAGRICELSPKPGGLYAVERITHIDHESREMTVEIEPRNAPAALPLSKNNLELKVVSLGEGKSEVIWKTSPELKTFGKVMKPLVKVGLSKSFGEVLQELKHFAETGAQHPRKVKKSAKAVA